MLEGMKVGEKKVDVNLLEFFCDTLLVCN